MAIKHSIFLLDMYVLNNMANIRIIDIR